MPSPRLCRVVVVVDVVGGWLVVGCCVGAGDFEGMMTLLTKFLVRV